MQNTQPTPSDDEVQRRFQSALYQNEPNSEANPQVPPPISSHVPYPNLENLYIFREANEVTSFLNDNPFLTPLLQEARMRIKKYFPNSDVILEVLTDPEIIGHKDLVAWIVVGKNVEESCEILDRFDEEYGWNIMRKSEDKLCIMLEYK